MAVSLHSGKKESKYNYKSILRSFSRVSVVYGQEVENLAADMEKIAVKRSQDAWNQQAQNVRDSDVIVLIGSPLIHAR